MLGKSIQGINEETMAMLISYDWPGNVRELENVIEFAINMEDSTVITTESLPNNFRKESIIYGMYDTRKSSAGLLRDK